MFCRFHSPSTDHVLTDAPIIVREDGPSSVLSCPDYIDRIPQLKTTQYGWCRDVRSREREIVSQVKFNSPQNISTFPLPLPPPQMRVTVLAERNTKYICSRLLYTFKCSDKIPNFYSIRIAAAGRYRRSLQTFILFFIFGCEYLKWNTLYYSRVKLLPFLELLIEYFQLTA